MKATRRTTWAVGDRFYVNRWTAAYPDPLVFTVVAVGRRGRRQIVWFRAPARWDPPTAPDRRSTSTDLHRDVRRGVLRRVWED